MAIRLTQLLTALVGCVCLVAGVQLLLVWANVLAVADGVLAMRILDEWGLLPLALVGSFFCGFGGTALVAACLLPSYRPWGHGLTIALAMLAVLTGWALFLVLPAAPYGNTAADVAVAAVFVGCGALVLAVLSWNSDEPAGLYALRLLCILAGLPVALGMGGALPEFVSGFFPVPGTSRGDVCSRGLALAAVSAFASSVLIAATGVNLLFPWQKRWATGVALLTAAGVAAVAMAAFSLWGGFFGRSKGGLAEAALIVVGLPFALVLFLLAATGVWYLRRPATRLALAREPDPTDYIPFLR